MLIVPLLALTPVYLRMRARRIASSGRWRSRSSSCCSSTSRRSRAAAALGLIAGALVLVVPYRRFFRSRQFLYPLGARRRRAPRRRSTSHRHFFETLPGQRVSTQGSSANAHFAVYSFIGHGPAHAPVARARQQQLRRLLRVRDREVELRRPLLLGRRDRRVGPARPRPLDRLPPLRLRAAARGAAARPAARPDRRSGRPARAAARVRDDGGARRDDRRQLLLPHDPVLLLLRLPRLRARPARRVRRARARAAHP